MVREMLRHVFLFPCYGNASGGSATTTKSANAGWSVAITAPLRKFYRELNSYQGGFRLVLSQLKLYQALIG